MYLYILNHFIDIYSLFSTSQHSTIKVAIDTSFQMLEATPMTESFYDVCIYIYSNGSIFIAFYNFIHLKRWRHVMCLKQLRVMFSFNSVFQDIKILSIEINFLLFAKQARILFIRANLANLFK